MIRSCPVCSLRISSLAFLLLELRNSVRKRSIPLRRRGAAAAAPRWDWSLCSHFLSNQTAVSGREPTRASLQVCAWLRPMIANRFLVTSNGDVRHCLCFLFAVEVNDGCGWGSFEETYLRNTIYNFGLSRVSLCAATKSRPVPHLQARIALDLLWKCFRWIESWWMG